MNDKTRRNIAMINGILTEAPKIRILFISPVATEPEVVRELLRCEAGIPEFICKTEYMPEITCAVGKFSGVRLFITSGARSWEDVMRQVSKCDRPDLVVIDHPELIQITPATPDNNHKKEGYMNIYPGEWPKKPKRPDIARKLDRVATILQIFQVILDVLILLLMLYLRARLNG